MRLVRTVVILSALFGSMFGASRADAQTPTGIVTGRMTDSTTKRPIAGARISVVGTSRATQTGDDGAYFLPNVGISTTSGSTQPLYVIDGVPVGSDGFDSPTRRLQGDRVGPEGCRVGVAGGLCVQDVHVGRPRTAHRAFGEWATRQGRI